MGSRSISQCDSAPVLRWQLVLPAVLVFAFATAGVSWTVTPSVAIADDEEEGEEEEKKVEIPAPPSHYLVPPADLDPEVKDQFQEALQLYERFIKTGIGKTRTRATKAFKKLNQKAPEFMAPYYYLCVLYQWDRDYRKARKTIKKALDKAPDFYEMYVELGDVDHHEGKIADAIPQYEKALAIYPYFEYGLDRMTQVLIELGRFEEAQSYLKKALLHGDTAVRTRLKTAIGFEVEGPKWKGSTFVSETDYYTVKSNHSQRVADAIAEEIDLTRELFDKLFPDIPKPDRKFLIVVYDSRESYIAGGAPPQSAAYYSGLAKRICMYVSNNKDEMYKNLKHEGFHQYVDEHVRRSPSWFGEGFAEFYSATELLDHGKKRAIRLRPHKRNLEFMLKVFENGAQTSPSDLMQMSQYEMYDIANGYRRMGLHYAQAWSMVYFIAEGPHDGYRKAMKKYFKALAKGKTQAQAYKSTWARIDMNKFEDQWISFIRKTYGKDKGI